MIDFDFAKIWHKIFAEKIELIAAGRIRETQPIEMAHDDSSCMLGKWLYGPGKRMEKLPAYGDLLNVHRYFHDMACRYLNTALAGRDQSIKDGVYADFKALSVSVIAAIERLQLAVQQEYDLHSTVYVPNCFSPGAQDDLIRDASLTIGISAIDEHHREIFTIANKLMQDPDASLNSEAAVDRLTELGKILDAHFTIEEAYMKQLAMPEAEFAAHQAEHQKFLEHYAEMNISSYMRRDRKVMDIASHIWQMALDHVVEYDIKIKKYLPV